MAEIDFTYLNEISGGDQEFITEMVQTFVDETPKDLTAMEGFLSSESWTDLGKVAHKMKSSIKMFGLPSLRDQVIHIEHCGKNGEELERLPQLVNAFVAECKSTLSDLAKHL